METNNTIVPAPLGIDHSTGNMLPRAHKCDAGQYLVPKKFTFQWRLGFEEHRENDGFLSSSLNRVEFIRGRMEGSQVSCVSRVMTWNDDESHGSSCCS